ncbi:MAG TPA: SLBB domain-containing protein [Syntrophorhabdaceae bacterium]|nr:SLBB domain-containing protein [Syntrophorhabdaceae bacterium]
MNPIQVMQPSIIQSDLFRQFQTQPSQPIQQEEQKRQQLPQRPIEEKPSEFEQYVAETIIEISEFQLDILKRLDGVEFRYSSKGLRKGDIALPVRIIKITKRMAKETEEERRQRESREFGRAQEREIKEVELAEKPILVDAGFIVGTREALIAAFKIVGIKNPFYVSTEIKQYGYELFRQQSSTFVPPVDKIPVGPEYIIGPGDELRITLWGNIEGNFNVVVDREGHINLPKVGVLGVAGLTFRELKEVLHKELSKYYTGFQMNVSMGLLRTIRVYVVGNAEKPGSYSISSLSTLVNGLFEAGGPSKTGSMRNIQLKRNGKTIVYFDMYDFLLKGDKSKDVRLMPEDVIFIPPIGPVVAIAGSVNNPAIYELKNETTLSQLIEMAGGLNAIAFKGRVQIERIVDNNRKVIFESDLNVSSDKDLMLQSGDTLKVFQIAPDKRVIRLAGAVFREGEYGFKLGMTVKDIINMAGGLKYYAFKKEAELTRLYVTDAGPKTEKIAINLDEALKGNPSHDIPLKEDDYLFVRSVPEWQQQMVVTVQGEVMFPGQYAIQKGERLSSLIERAGGYTDKAYLRGAVFTRERVRELQQKNLEDMVSRLEKELFSAGSAQIATALSAEEVMARKGEIEQKQRFIETLKQMKAKGRMTIRLAHLRLLKGSEYDIELEDGDNLYIPVVNDVVNVVGSVMSEGSFVFNEKLDYNDYIEMAGGYSRYADKDTTYILKVDGSAVRPQGGWFSWSSSRSRWEMTGFTEQVNYIEPGDTIVVPEKIDRIAWLRNIKDITQILANMAQVVGIIKALY